MSDSNWKSLTPKEAVSASSASMLEYSIIWIILTGAVFGVTFLSPREFPLYVWLLGSAGAAVFLVGFTWSIPQTVAPPARCAAKCEPRTLSGCSRSRASRGPTVAVAAATSSSRARKKADQPTLAEDSHFTLYGLRGTSRQGKGGRLSA